MPRMRDETSLIIPAIRAVLDEALAAGRRTTGGGKAIDEHQVHAERLAYAATEAAAAEALAAYAAERRAAAATEFRHRGLVEAAPRTTNLSRRRPGTRSALRPAQTLRRDPLLGCGAGRDGLKGGVAAATAKFRARREASATFRASDDAGRGQSYPGNTAEAAALRGR